MVDPERVTKEFVHTFKMVDGELELALKGIGWASAPDQGLKVISFQMLHTVSREEMGALNLRVGYTQNVVLYRGNIGFTVFDPFNGQHYSSRSCRLLVPMLKELQFSPIWITCNPDNVPSKRNIERIGANLVETATVPPSYEFAKYYPPEARTKLRFRWDIS